MEIHVLSQFISFLGNSADIPEVQLHPMTLPGESNLKPTQLSGLLPATSGHNGLLHATAKAIAAGPPTITWRPTVSEQFCQWFCATQSDSVGRNSMLLAHNPRRNCHDAMMF